MDENQLMKARWWGQYSGDMMLAVTQPDTQQESEVVGNTIGHGPTEQTPSHSAKRTRGNIKRVSSISQE